MQSKAYISHSEAWLRLLAIIKVFRVCCPVDLMVKGMTGATAVLGLDRTESGRGGRQYHLKRGGVAAIVSSLQIIIHFDTQQATLAPYAVQELMK